MKRTKKRSGWAWSMNQKATSKPTARRTVRMVSQSRLPHLLVHVNIYWFLIIWFGRLGTYQSVSKKQTPRTILATLLATISNPQNVSNIPITEEPKYPAGRVIALIPPRICVTPPSCGSREIDSTLPPVQQAVIACPNSWKAITSIYPPC
jgi:hypothetical protein